MEKINLQALSPADLSKLLYPWTTNTSATKNAVQVPEEKGGCMFITGRKRVQCMSCILRSACKN